MVETTTTDASASSKKQKTFPMSPDEEWPEAWLMPAAEQQSSDDNAFDQCAENRCEPNVPVTPAELKELGIYYWKMPDVDVYKVCCKIPFVCGVGFVISYY